MLWNKQRNHHLFDQKERIRLQRTSTACTQDSSFLSTKDQEMCVALKSALLNPLFRKVLENLSDFEKRENFLQPLMAVNPELFAHPELFGKCIYYTLYNPWCENEYFIFYFVGILSDPDLLNTYINRNNIKTVLQRYPYFLEVATHISATFHEESSSGNPFHLDGLDRSAFMNYSIDAPSDDEMDDSEASSVSSTNTQASARLTEHPTQSFSNMLMRAYQTRNHAGPQSAASTSSIPVITQGESMHF